MQLGKALVGAIVGAVLGVGVLVAVYLIFGMDAVWLAVIVAALTGLGVRTLVSTSGHASYARGALTGVLALGAYVGGWYLVAELAQARAAAAPKRAPIAVAEQPADTDEDAEPAGEVPPVEVPRPVERAPSGAAMPKAVAPGQNPMDYIWLGIAALVAYELGRGTGAKPVEVTETETPGGAHPDA